MRNSPFCCLFIFFFVLTWSATTCADEETSVSGTGQTASGDTAAAISPDSADWNNAVPVEWSDTPPPGLEPEAEEVYEMNISVTAGLEYNDNIDNQAHNKKSDLITRVQPFFVFKRLGGRITADINYRGNYLFYMQGRDTEEYRHYINATVTGELVENLFFLSIKESMDQVYRDVSLGEVEDEESLNDLINKNRLIISPHFKLRPSERTNLTIGYDFVDLRYSKGIGDEYPKPFAFNSEMYNFNYKKSQSHTVYLQLSHELSERATLFTGGNVTRWIDNDIEDNDIDQSYYRYTIYAGGLYQFSENLSLSVKAGPSFSSPDEQASKTKPFIEANLLYAIGRSTFDIFYKTTYEDNSDTGGSTQKDQYGIRWNKEFDRSNLVTSLSYSTYEDGVERSRRSNDRGDTIRPSIGYTYELSDRLSSFIRYHSTLYVDEEKGNNRHYGRYGIRYELSPKDNLALSHQIRYTDVYNGDSYYTNKVMLDFTHRF